MKRIFVIVWLLACLGVRAAEVIPPVPTRYFNDYANVVSPAVANQLNGELEDFERQTSSQILVAIYPKMQSDSSIDDYAVRVARAWKVGQKAKDNGAVLFVFVQDHKMSIQVGYGLEGAMPDITCNQIIEEEIAPHFKQGDYNGGLTAGVTAMMAAAKGEYKGNGRTVEDTKAVRRNNWRSFIPLLIIIFIVVRLIMRSGGRGGGGGLGGFATGWWLGGGGGGWGGGGGGGGGGFSGGGGGGFSGGGGSFGGGGASGGW